MNNKKPFRDHHLLALLAEYEKQPLPLDLAIHRYFRAHPALGSKDRGAIAEITYGLVRWRGWLDWVGGPPHSWERRLASWRRYAIPPDEVTAQGAPPHIVVSFPKELFEYFVATFGLERTLQVCNGCNSAAPTTVRVNSLKTTREALFSRLASQFDLRCCSQAPYGLTFSRRHNLFGLPEFKEGLFEMQDEASQLVAALVQVKPGDWFLDYCAGAGGKTLAIAPAMNNRGQIFLHDIRPWALAEAQQRLRRAGIQNAQIAAASSGKLELLRHKMDWILVDAPCSGTGTLRRNPDMKWRFSKEMVLSLVEQQRQIFAEALTFLKSSGHIVYATCSLLRQENEEQLDYFLKTHALRLCGEPFLSVPQAGGMDGFFAAVLAR